MYDACLYALALSLRCHRYIAEAASYTTYVCMDSQLCRIEKYSRTTCDKAGPSVAAMVYHRGIIYSNKITVDGLAN